MSKYTVELLLTRRLTANLLVSVEAKDEDEAADIAVALFHDGKTPDADWDFYEDDVEPGEVEKEEEDE